MNNENNARNLSESSIKIWKAEEKDLPGVIKMLSHRMANSIEQSYLLDGINAKEELTEVMITTQVEDVYRVGEIWVAGDYQGALTGHYGNGFTLLSLLRTSLRQNKQLKQSIAKPDLEQLSINIKKTAGTRNLRWRKQVCGSEHYYYLQLIAIESSLKGSGVFRRLVEPILIRAERESIPVLLDTHDKDNVPLYEHFGFELIKEHHAKGDESIIQYSMMRPCQE